jgi:hypothetical protein
MRFEITRNGVRDVLAERSQKAYDKLRDGYVPDESITGFDDDEMPCIVMDAEKCAIVRMVIDHEWKNPAMRWAMIESAYTEMRKRLKAKGYSAAYCFFPDGVPNSYIRRLVGMGADRIIDRCIRFSAEEG